MRIVIAIDGPAGSGKSTIAREVADRLGLPHIDTGAIYRAFTLKALRGGIDVDDAKALQVMAHATKIELRDGRVVLDGEDVTNEIRTPPVTSSVSEISSHLDVRSEMVRLQRDLIDERGAVVEGRDIGTVVFPDAALKVYLTASPDERARRRRADLAVDGILRTIEETLDEINRRDRFDSSREISPLTTAEDAIVIDSTGRSIEDISAEICRLAPEAP